MHKSQTGISPNTPEIVLKSIFRRYDIDGNGDLSKSEFTNALDDLGVVDETEQNALFLLADTNNKKYVNYHDFVKLIKSNDFESILDSPKDYEFVIETYKAFTQYDDDGDGEVTWNEFYFYLTKHGYSHQYISQYWYYMRPDSNQIISFEGFWKCFKAQYQSPHYNLQKQINKEILIETSQKKRTKKYNKTLKTPSFKKLVRNNSWNDHGSNNVFNYVKRHLTKSGHLRNVSPFTVKMGKVIDSKLRLKPCYSASNLENLRRPTLTQSKSVILDTNDSLFRVSDPCDTCDDLCDVAMHSLRTSILSNSISFSNSLSNEEFTFIDYGLENERDSNCSNSLKVLPKLVKSKSMDCNQPKIENLSSDNVLKKKKRKKLKKKRGKYGKNKKFQKRKKRSESHDSNVDRRSVLFPRKKKKRSRKSKEI